MPVINPRAASQSARISGVYDTSVGKLIGSTCMSLHAEVAYGAAEDAGLDINDIDGVLCAYSFTEPHLMLSSVFCEYMGIRPPFSTSIQSGGATAAVMVQTAAALVRSGMCRHVLCVTGDNRVTGMTRDQAVAAIAAIGHPQYESPYGLSVPSSYALVAKRYMHEYGTTTDQLGEIAVVQRKHAGLTEKAQMRDPITLDDVRNSKVISDPIRMLDCCLISDGAAAVVVSAAETAEDLKSPQVGILGSSQSMTHEHISAAPSLTQFGCGISGPAALAEAGLKPSDIDVAEIYDSFTITLLIELESIGFFEKGEAGAAIARGETTFGGKLPCNTHGGLLSYGHSGAAGGMFHIVEAVRQLRGECGARQVPDAETAFVHGDGGILSFHSSMALGRL